MCLNMTDFLVDNKTLITLMLALFGTAWTLYRYFKEGLNRPRIEFDIECNTLGPQGKNYLAEFTVFAFNKGNIKFTFPDIRLRVLGITRDSDLLLWKGHGKRLDFPIKLFNEQVIPPKFKYIFVEPGVKQGITYVTTVPENIKFIVARASFKYRFRNAIHTREKVFEIK